MKNLTKYASMAIIAVMACGASIAVAQNRTHGRIRPSREKVGIELGQRAERERLLSLGLDEAQIKKVDKLIDKRHKAELKQLREQKEREEKYAADLKKVLTPEQYENYVKAIENSSGRPAPQSRLIHGVRGFKSDKGDCGGSVSHEQLIKSAEDTELDCPGQKSTCGKCCPDSVEVCPEEGLPAAPDTVPGGMVGKPQKGPRPQLMTD